MRIFWISLIVLFFNSCWSFCSPEIIKWDDYCLQFKKPDENWTESSAGEFPFRTKGGFRAWMRETQFGKAAIYIIASRLEREYLLDTIIEADVEAEQERQSKIEKRNILEIKEQEFFWLTFHNENGIGYYPGYPGYKGKDRKLPTRCSRAVTTNGPDVIEFNFCSPAQIHNFLGQDFKELLHTISFTSKGEAKEMPSLPIKYSEAKSKDDRTEERLNKLEKGLEEIVEKLNKVLEIVETQKKK